MTEIELIEYQEKAIAQAKILPDMGELLWHRYGKQIEVSEPSFKNNRNWTLKARGYIGTIPVAPDFTVRILPKTPIDNIWQMLARVGDLGSLQIFETLTACDCIEDLCDLLARQLARRIRQRTQQGLFATYLPETARLAAVRGRVDWPRAARSPWQPRLPCCYTTRSADIPDNQILLWTLHHLRRTRHLLQPPTQAELRAAHRGLQSTISLVPYTAEACRDRAYHRLNEDYRLLHALCHFFLAGLSPGQVWGDRAALPFLVNTATLYENFVAYWLQANLPAAYQLKIQEAYRFTATYRIDLVIYDRATQQPLAVLDTKYKVAPPSAQDIGQIIAYAHFKQVPRAILIYPQLPDQAIDRMSHDIRVQAVAFQLESDLEVAGFAMLRALDL